MSGVFQKLTALLILRDRDREIKEYCASFNNRHINSPRNWQKTIFFFTAFVSFSLKTSSLSVVYWGRKEKEIWYAFFSFFWRWWWPWCIVFSFSCFSFNVFLVKVDVLMMFLCTAGIFSRRLFNGLTSFYHLGFLFFEWFWLWEHGFA